MKRLFSLLFIFFTVPVYSQNQDLEKLFEEEIRKEVRTETKKQDFTGRPAQFQFQILNRSWTLDLMAAVDSVYEWDNNADIRTTKRQYYIRTGEFGFYSAIDQLAHGTLTFAAHYEDGKLFPEVHEAFFLFPATLLPRTNIRLGRMFPDVGRLNGHHQHDWPFTTPPLVHNELLDYEGILDTGIEIAYLFPWKFWQELVVGIYNGKVYGHAHSEGELKQNPMFTMHLKQFFPLSDFWGTEFGFSFLRWHPTTEPNRWIHQIGFDYYLKYKEGKLGSFIYQAEIWYREDLERKFNRWKYYVDDNGNPVPPEQFVENRNFNPPEKMEILGRNFGLYHFIQYMFYPRWYIGYRYDYYYEPSKERNNPITGVREYQKNGFEENSIILTHKPSEFSYFRIQASNLGDFETGKKYWQYYFQAVFIIGMHPAHKY